jgi:hypothetical protein
VQLVFWGSLTTIVVSLVTAAIRRDMDATTRTWWIPALATVLVSILLVVGLTLEAAAIDQPFPRF